MIANVVADDSATTTLRDGRLLGYAVSGDGAGHPVVLVPGFGHSRLAKHPDGNLTASAGIKLISLDMPGIGRSETSPGYTLLSWVDDVVQLVDTLGHDRFSVIGWSWGAPYALATAYKLPQRVVKVGVVSGLGGWLTGPGASKDVKPEFRTFGLWCRYVPFAAKAFIRSQARSFMRNPMDAVEHEAQKTGGDDARVASQPVIAQMLTDSGREVWSRGAEGIYEHGRAVAMPWGFEPRHIAAPVEIWHGEGDREISPRMAERLAGSIEHSKLTMLKGRGHLMLFAEWTSVLRSLSQ